MKFVKPWINTKNNATKLRIWNTIDIYFLFSRPNKSSKKRPGKGRGLIRDLKQQNFQKNHLKRSFVPCSFIKTLRRTFYKLRYSRKGPSSKIISHMSTLTQSYTYTYTVSNTEKLRTYWNTDTYGERNTHKKTETDQRRKRLDKEGENKTS